MFETTLDMPPSPPSDDTIASCMYFPVFKQTPEELTELLKKYPLLINQRDLVGYSPLHIAVTYYNDIHCIEILHQFGAALNARDRLGFTPAHLAARYGKVDFLTTLNRLGADLHITDKLGSTLAHTAVKYNQKEILTYLSQLNFDLNIKDYDGCRPVHVAVKQGNNPILIDLHRLLGQSFNTPNDQGDTLAHVALTGMILGEPIEVLQQLQKLGVCLNTRNHSGETPADIADKMGWNRTKKELERLSIQPVPDDSTKENDDNAYFTFNCLAAIALGTGALMLAIALLPVLPTTIAPYVAYMGAGFVAGGLLLGAYGFFANKHSKTANTDQDSPVPDGGFRSVA